MDQVAQIERHRCRTPVKTGWYYGRDPDLPRAVPLQVVHVLLPGHTARQLRVLRAGRYFQLKDFDWYGPVPDCVILD